MPNTLRLFPNKLLQRTMFTNASPRVNSFTKSNHIKIPTRGYNNSVDDSIDFAWRMIKYSTYFSAIWLTAEILSGMYNPPKSLQNDTTERSKDIESTTKFEEDLKALQAKYPNTIFSTNLSQKALVDDIKKLKEKYPEVTITTYSPK